MVRRPFMFPFLPPGRVSELATAPCTDTATNTMQARLHLRTGYHTASADRRPGVASMMKLVLGILALHVGAGGSLLLGQVAPAVSLLTLDAPVNPSTPSLDLTLAGSPLPQFRIAFRVNADGESEFNLIALDGQSQWHGDADAQGIDPMGQPDFNSPNTGVRAVAFSALADTPWAGLGLDEIPEIHGNLAWWNPGFAYGAGHFLGKIGGYIAVRVPASEGNWHYGWLELTVDAQAQSLTLHRVAWNPQPDGSILAGQVVLPSRTYSAWAHQVFGPDQENPLADPLQSWAQDGLLNLIAFATGRNPATASGAPPPEVTLTELPLPRQRVRFHRDPSSSQVRIRVLASSDLSYWVSVAQSLSGGPLQLLPAGEDFLLVESLSPDGILWSAEVTDSRAPAAGEPRFLRLEVSLLD